MDEYTYAGNKDPYIYLAFAPCDKDDAHKVAEALAAVNKVYASPTYGPKDKKALAKASAFVVLLSAGAGSTLDEVVFAASRQGVGLVPVYLDDAGTSEGLAMVLGTTQGVMASQYEGDGYVQAVAESPALAHLEATDAQKRAARATLVGALVAAAAVIAVVVLLVLPMMGVIMPWSTLGKMGLSGNVDDIQTLYLYGSELRDAYEEDGAFMGLARSDADYARIYLPRTGEEITVGTLSDISDFAQLKNLSDLALVGNSVGDLSPLSGLKNLTRLDLSIQRAAADTPAGQREEEAALSLVGISALSSLKSLNIAFCDFAMDEEGNVLGVDELLDLPALETLYLSHSQGQVADALEAGGATFDIVYVDQEVTSYEDLTTALADGAHALYCTAESLDIPEGDEVVIPAGTTLEGIFVTINNRGTVRLQGVWEMGMASKNNEGTIIVEDGGVFSGGMGDSTNTGAFRVEAGGTHLLERGEQFMMNDGTYTVEGTLFVRDGGSFQWNGGRVVNDGTIHLRAMEGDDGSRLFVGDTAAIEGSGELISE